MCFAQLPALVPYSNEVYRCSRIMGWNHGYFSYDMYISSSYREMAPNWIDFAGLLRGHAPRRMREGQSFSYLELGCGTGYGLCLLAALYPEGTFVGIDFMPEHIAHAQDLAQDLCLQNVSFSDADLIQLANNTNDSQRLAIGMGTFDYVASHGVITWVIPLVQEALLSVASASLRPGGVFYCSYNTYPGWLSRTVIHRLVDIERKRVSPSSPMAPVENAGKLLTLLLGGEGKPTQLAQHYPGLTDHVARLRHMNQRYLSQEYANDGWEPVYAIEMFERCISHRLHFVGSAKPSDHFLEILEDVPRAAILSEADPLVRETLVDIAINRSFRRDLFVKGMRKLTPTRIASRLGLISFSLQEPKQSSEFIFNTCFGMIKQDPEICEQLTTALDSGPLCLADLSSRVGKDLRYIAKLAALFLEDRQWGIDRAEGTAQALGICKNVNLVLQELMRDGSVYNGLADPSHGNCVEFSIAESIVCACLANSLQQEDLPNKVDQFLKALGIRVGSPAKASSHRQDSEPMDLSGFIGEFAGYRYPQLKALKVI